MHQHGFSLIELLMGLTIVGIVLYLISPALAAFTESSRRDEASRSLIAGIRNARTLAMTRNQAVVIHGIDGDWGRGWRIILDLSGKGADDRDNPLIAEHASNTGVPIAGNWWVRRYIRFSSLGMPLMPERAFQAGTLHLCDTREPVSRRQIVLAPSGRVSLLDERAEQALCEQ
ncbi:GspH/FimT family pseudopilin [Pseudomonas sp. MYb118]|uniref:GspH/FimT family pseudopilin n=1 Tax=Pseudomonas sp. MYb118 TaxID=1848720 RepID=UPI0034CD98BE